MEILESLIPRVTDNFEIPLITIRQTIDLLNKLKTQTLRVMMT